MLLGGVRLYMYSWMGLVEQLSRVCPVEGSSGPQSTLLLRSSCLRWRHLGGSTKASGRNNGWVNRTKDVIEAAAPGIAKAIAEADFNMSWPS
jgi:hypothetical protein